MNAEGGAVEGIEEELGRREGEKNRSGCKSKKINNNNKEGMK